jgi:hemerythrin-like domain-containing protein
VAEASRPADALWDESTRPHGPVDPVAGSVDGDAAGTGAGRHLVDVHDHLRQELAQLLGMIDQVVAGTLDAGAARGAINAMTMRQNNWTLGAYCQSYCRVLTLHHTLEDQALFPHLRTADPRLVPVLDRLAAEHEAIAEVLEEVDAALVALVAKPEATADVQRAVRRLSDGLLSHLGYEERELVGPLDRWPPPFGPPGS